MDLTPLDLISLLPDALLIIIVSMLPFKDAVRTSVLSRKWQYFWQSTANVRFDEQLFRDQLLYGGGSNISRMDFVRFVDRFIAAYKEVNLVSFQCIILQPLSELMSTVQKCFAFIDAHPGLKILMLKFRDSILDEYTLHSHEQTAFIRLSTLDSQLRTLEKLTLCACDFQLPSYDKNNVYFIKCLVLSWVELPDFCLNEFVDMCPLLESLHLERCTGIKKIDICALRLQDIVINSCSIQWTISLIAPSLRSFKYVGFFINMSFENYGGLLKNAILDFSLQHHYVHTLHLSASILYYLFADFRNVQSLTIGSYSLQTLVMAVPEFRMQKSFFTNIRRLIVSTQLLLPEYRGFIFFLTLCPNLETLSIHLDEQTIFPHSFDSVDIDDHPFLTHSWSPVCVEQRLKRIKVKKFKGGNNEIIILSFFLKFGRVLEQLIISLLEEEGSNKGLRKLEFRANVQKLMAGEIASPKLRVLVSNY